MLDPRLIPGPTLARVTIDDRLRALGYARGGVTSRTHLRYRLQSWLHPAGSSVFLCEVHSIGERLVIVEGEPPEGLEAALEVVPRATISHELGAATEPQQALPWLRRLCLLDHDAPSPVLRAHLERMMQADDLVVRSAALAAAMNLAPEHVTWALELAASAETHPTLRADYERTAKAQRAAAAKSAAGGRKSPAKPRAGKKS